MQNVLTSEIKDAEELLGKFKAAVEASSTYSPDVHRTSALLANRMGVMLGYVARWDLMDNSRPTIDEV